MAKKVTINGSNLLNSTQDAWGGQNSTQYPQTIHGTTVPPGAEWGMNRGEVERFIKSSITAQASMVGYYTCESSASSTAKTVVASGYKLTTGGCLRIKMTNANTANNVTLNINSTGAYPLFYGGERASSSNSWEAGEVLEVYYDGTQYQCASGGGGKFATGQKVKEVSITDTLNNTSALPESQAVYLPVKNLNDTVFGTDQETIIVPRTEIFKPNNVIQVNIDYRGVIKNGDRIQFTGTNGYVAYVGIVNAAGTVFEKNYTNGSYISSVDVIYNDGDGRNIRFIVKRSDGVSASIQDVENNTDESITRTVLSGGLERRVEVLENEKPTIKALFIGNSVSQDHVAYLPWLLKNTYGNDINFEIFIAYKGGATIKYYVENIINGTVPVEIFSHARNTEAWTNTNNFAYADIWTAYGPFDMICYEGYFNHSTSSAGQVEDTAYFMPFVNDLKTRQTKPFKLGYLMHQTYTTSTHTEADAWKRIVDGAIFAIENTPVSILFPCGVVTKLVNGEIPQATLTNDNTHNQQGLPCIMGAYTLVEELVRYMGLPSKILNNPLRITSEIETSLNIPGPNGTLQVGTDAQYSLCQDAAVEAVKYGDMLMYGDVATSQAVKELFDISMKKDEAKVISDALNELKANEENTMGKNEAFVLASALNDLNKRIEEGGGGGGSSSAYPFSGEVTIANSERISVVGSSFGTGSFNLAGKAWHAKLALFSDYQFDNISYDGFNYISILRYLRLGQITFSGRYALLCNNENDHGLSLAYQLKSLENIATWMKVFGAEPILATSYPDYSYRSDLWREHAKRNNYMFWDAAKYCSMIRGAKNGAWDGARHLATRNSQMVSDAYMPYMLAMERPMQSIKVFRLRSFVNYANLDDLIFKDNIRRAELFMELFFGTACNTNPASVDDIANCHNGGLVNEYRSLQGSGVLFSAPFLISAVIPVNASDLLMLQLVMSAGKAVKVYVMNRKEPPFPEGGTYTRFSVLSEIDSPEQGAVYSTGGTNYTVVSVVYGENGYHYTMYCSPAISSSMGSGTLTKVSGNGPASIPFQIAEQSTLGGETVVDSDTVGHWVEVTPSGSSYAISGTLLSNCVEIDTIHFLVIPQDTDCLISNISVKYGGSKMKKSSTRVYYDFENSDFFESSELVQEPTFGAVGTTLTHWTDKEGGTLTSVADYENLYPKGQSIINVNSNIGMKQTIPAASLRSGRYVLQVISRYFPPIYTNGSGNQITPDSYDFETLNVTISNGGESQKTAMMSDVVGTYWKISQFDLDLFTSEDMTITVDAGTKGLEICYVSLKRKEY